LIKNTEPAAANEFGDHDVAERNVTYFTVCTINHSPEETAESTKTL
jgi:hypothetical protein